MNTPKNKSGRPTGKNVVKVTTTLTKPAAAILQALKPKGGETISRLLVEHFTPIVVDGKWGIKK